MNTRKLKGVLFNSKELKDLILLRLTELNISKRKMCIVAATDPSHFNRWLNGELDKVNFNRILFIINSLGIYIKVMDKNVAIIKYPLDCSIFDCEYQAQTSDDILESASVREKNNYGKNLAETIRRFSDYDDKRLGNSLGKS